MRINIVASKTTARKYSPRTLITKRDSISRGSCFCEKYRYSATNKKVLKILDGKGPLTFCKKAVERINSHKNILNSSVEWSGVDWFFF